MAFFKQYFYYNISSIVRGDEKLNNSSRFKSKYCANFNLIVFSIESNEMVGVQFLAAIIQIFSTIFREMVKVLVKLKTCALNFNHFVSGKTFFHPTNIQ